MRPGPQRRTNHRLRRNVAGPSTMSDLGYSWTLAIPEALAVPRKMRQDLANRGVDFHPDGTWI